MIIYKLQRSIDGYGGHFPDEYFRNYEDAKNVLLNNEALWFHDGTWDVSYMKECIWNENEKEGSFYLRGIPYPNETEDDAVYNIQYCKVSISPIELDFEPESELYVLKFCKGYYHWLLCSLDGINSDNYDLLNTQTIFGYYKNKKKARKAAKYKSLKRIARVWEKPEEEERISPLGRGEDYLSIEKITLN